MNVEYLFVGLCQFLSTNVEFLFVGLCSLSFISVLQFSVYGSFTSLVKFISEYCIFRGHCKWG